MSEIKVTDLKSNNTLPVVFKNASGVQVGTLCRAWVNFNGTGTPTIRDKFNVSSITDVNVGTYGINFTMAMPDDKYAVAYSGRPTTDVVCNPWEPQTPTYSARSVNAVYVRFANQTPTVIDPDIVSVVVFR